MVGARISQLRKARNMTQRDLARVLNVSPSAIGMYEQGRRQPSAELIVAICREFAVSTQWLLTGRPYSVRELRQDLSCMLSLETGGDLEPGTIMEIRQLLSDMDREVAAKV